VRDSIQMASCSANEILPMNPEMPADLFTSCLTTPIEIALRWFVLHNSMLTDLSVDVVDKIPGKNKKIKKKYFFCPLTQKSTTKNII